MTLSASIDCGTNTFRLLIADISPAGTLTPLRCERIITRLGEGFHQSGAIRSPASRRSINALHAFVTIIKAYPVTQVHAVSTSVVREAINGESFVSAVMEQTGIRVKVLSAFDEARLTLCGVIASVRTSGLCLIVDIGGGSTELISSRNGVPLHTESIRLGVVHLSERLIRTDPPSRQDLLSLQLHINQACDAAIGHDLFFPRNAGSPAPAKLVGTAGSITTLAAIDQNMHRYDPGKINNCRLSLERIADLFDRLSGMNRNERICVPGLERGREDLIIPGAAILLHIMTIFGFDTLTVSDGGLLEGILIDAHRSQHTS